MPGPPPTYYLTEGSFSPDEAQVILAYINQPAKMLGPMVVSLGAQLRWEGRRRPRADPRFDSPVPTVRHDSRLRVDGASLRTSVGVLLVSLRRQ